jgi:hypothetical protein
VLHHKAKVVTTDDVFLAMVIEDGPAKEALVSLGMDASAMRSEVMRTRAGPE